MKCTKVLKLVTTAGIIIPAAVVIFLASILITSKISTVGFEIDFYAICIFLIISAGSVLVMLMNMLSILRIQIDKNTIKLHTLLRIFETEKGSVYITGDDRQMLKLKIVSKEGKSKKLYIIKIGYSEEQISKLKKFLYS